MAVSSRPQRWLSIVGIGEDGVEGLSPVARRLVSDAELVVGGKRHLALADPLIKSRAAGLAEPDRRRPAGNREAPRPAGVPCWRAAIPSTTASATC